MPVWNRLKLNNWFLKDSKNVIYLHKTIIKKWNGDGGEGNPVEANYSQEDKPQIYVP